MHDFRELLTHPFVLFHDQCELIDFALQMADVGVDLSGRELEPRESERVLVDRDVQLLSHRRINLKVWVTKIMRLRHLHYEINLLKVDM